MIRDTAAKRYARAAFGVALECGTLDRWSDDLRLIAAVMGDAQALALLANTKVPLAERYRLLEATLSGIDAQAMNLALLLVANGRWGRSAWAGWWPASATRSSTAAPAASSWL